MYVIYAQKMEKMTQFNGDHYTTYVKQNNVFKSVFFAFRDLVTSTLESRQIVQEMTNEIILSHLWIWDLGTISPSLITR